jgi:hypothetical protein
MLRYLGALLVLLGCLLLAVDGTRLGPPDRFL